MSRASSPGYTLTSSSRHCAATGRELRTGEPFVAALALLPVDAVEAGRPGGGTPAVDYERQDFSLEAWDQGARPRMRDGETRLATGAALPVLGFWRAAMQEPGAKKRLLVDDDALLDLFEQTETDAGAVVQVTGEPASDGAFASEEGAATPREDERLAFRFFLALILMRKKLLICEKVDKDGTMHVRPKGSAKPSEGGTLAAVVDPRIDEASMSRVLGQLSAVLGQ